MAILVTNRCLFGEPIYPLESNKQLHVETKIIFEKSIIIGYLRRRTISGKRRLPKVTDVDVLSLTKIWINYN